METVNVYFEAGTRKRIFRYLSYNIHFAILSLSPVSIIPQKSHANFHCNTSRDKKRSGNWAKPGNLQPNQYIFLKQISINIRHCVPLHCVILGFCRGVNQIFPLLGCYTALIGGCIQTIRNNLLVHVKGQAFQDFLTLLYLRRCNREVAPKRP
jgi:hypothetical protein